MYIKKDRHRPWLWLTSDDSLSIRRDGIRKWAVCKHGVFLGYVCYYGAPYGPKWISVNRSGRVDEWYTITYAVGVLVDDQL